MKSEAQRVVAIAQRLRLAREQSGLSQGQVAKMLDLHRPTVSEIEAGRRKVSAEEIAEFARIYKVNTKWLTDATETDLDEARIELAARELSKLKPKDLERLLGLLKTLRTEEDNK